jgi:hypothetical protein
MSHSNRIFDLSLAALALFLICFAVAPGYGQIVNASLSGSVADQSGAVIPGAAVTATNTETGVATKTESDAAGNYILLSLPAGNYKITTQRVGFKSTVLTGITLLVDQKARIDIQLQVGEVTTTVEVSGAAPLVETSTASVGTVIGQQQVVELPLNARRFGNMATLVHGQRQRRVRQFRLWLGVQRGDLQRQRGALREQQHPH